MPDHLAPSEHASSTPPYPPFALGVLFVHGIGRQAARETLVSWGDAILETITHATDHRVTARVEQASPGDGSGDHTAEAVAVLSVGEHQPEYWLMREAWWAETFPPPRYSELASWSVRATPWAVALHVAQRYWQRAGEDQGVTRGLALASALLQLVVALALAPLAILVLTLTLVLGLLPIPRLRSFMLSLQSGLVGTIGDSLVFVESPIRASLIRTRILAQLERMIPLCEKTIIVAHSQGAAAVLDALGGIAEPDPSGDSPASPPDAGPVPDTLLTFGAGINQLVSLKVLSRGLPGSMAVNPALFAAGWLLPVIVLFGWLASSLRAGRISLALLGEAFAALVVASALASIVLWGFRRFVWRRQVPDEGAPDGKDRTWPAVIALLAIVAIMIAYANWRHLPLGVVSWLLLAVMAVAGSLARVLSQQLKSVVSAPVRDPAGLARWDDIYASADPVPNGPTRIEGDTVCQPVRTWNQGSILADHTSYWRNLDGFVLRVARACAETAGSHWRDMLADVSTAAEERAQRRVTYLVYARWIIVAAALFALVVLLKRHGATFPLPFELPAETPLWMFSALRWLLVTLLVVLGAWAFTRLLVAPWLVWVRSEQFAVLRGETPDGWPLLQVTLPGIVVSLALHGAWALGNDLSLTAITQSMAADPWGLVARITGLGLMLGLALWRLARPGRRRGPRGPTAALAADRQPGPAE